MSDWEKLRQIAETHRLLAVYAKRIIDKQVNIGVNKELEAMDLKTSAVLFHNAAEEVYRQFQEDNKY
jgi:hypothetical protein